MTSISSSVPLTEASAHLLLNSLLARVKAVSEDGDATFPPSDSVAFKGAPGRQDNSPHRPSSSPTTCSLEEGLRCARALTPIESDESGTANAYT